MATAKATAARKAGERARRAAPAAPRHDYLTLATSSNAVLEEALRQGGAPDMAKLAGWEFRGYNSPDFTSILGFRKFKKGFYLPEPNRDPSLGIGGYNVKVVQNGLMDPWLDVVKKGESVKHGFYEVYPVRPHEKDNRYPNSLLLNYACPRNSMDPSRVLRDYVVQVHADNPDLLLGKAYVALGSARVFVSFFILERSNPSTLKI